MIVNTFLCIALFAIVNTRWIKIQKAENIITSNYIIAGNGREEFSLVIKRGSGTAQRAVWESKHH